MQGVEILCGDFEQTFTHIETNTFFFIDPPYKPLNKTSNFNSYSKYKFDDEEQIRLRDYCIKLDQSDCKWILCNSDIKAHNPEDNFFDELYNGFNIYRVKAKRNINSKVEGRGEINELLITNFSPTALLILSIIGLF